MSTLAQIADKNPNCNGASADTGTLGCQIEFGTPLHAIATRKGTVVPKDTLFDKVYIDTQVQLGIFIPLTEADSFEEMSSEDSFNTNTRGVDRLSVLGLPKYKLTYQQGHQFYKQIARLTSFKSMDFIFGDDSGNWKLAVNADGDFTGFSVGQVTAMMGKTKVQGGDPESKSIVVQMLDRDQWDKNYAILGRASLTFSPGDIDGINGIEITLGPITPGATTLSINAALASDRITPVSGLVLADFLTTADGAKVVATAAVEDSAVDGKYTITVPAMVAAKKIVVSTYDDTTKTLAILSAGILFRGTSNTVITADPPVPAPVMTSPNTIAVTSGVARTFQITGTNSPTSFGITGSNALPSGASINTATGLISFTTGTIVGVYPIQIVIFNSGNFSSPQTITITVS